MDKEQWQEKGSGHRARLRERFLQNGLDGFSDVEILELLLSFGTPRKDCKQPARDLLKRFKTLPGVLDADNKTIREINGIGPLNAFALPFIKSVADRYLKERLRDRSYLKSSQEVNDYLVHTMRGLQIEVFTVIYLDSALGIIESEVVAEGTVNVNSVYPREIIKRALSHNAAALVVAHNHPSGATMPSNQDRELTRQLYLGCSLMQIKLLDHLIIGAECYSFADHGLMAEVERWCSSISQSGVEPSSR